MEEIISGGIMGEIVNKDSSEEILYLFGRVLILIIIYELFYHTNEEGGNQRYVLARVSTAFSLILSFPSLSLTTYSFMA